MSTTFYLTLSYNWNVVYNNPRLGRVKHADDRRLYISMVSCPKGPTRHAYAWQIGPFWQDTLDMKCMRQLMANGPCHGKELLTMLSLQHIVFFSSMNFIIGKILHAWISNNSVKIVSSVDWCCRETADNCHPLAYCTCQFPLIVVWSPLPLLKMWRIMQMCYPR